MALSNLHEIIRNLTAYIKSLDVLCENGLRLSKNFEKILGLLSSSGCGPGSGDGASPTGQIFNHDVEAVSQTVTTWELAHKVATTDTNALISEILPLLQETVQNTLKDPASFQSSSTYEVFRSCFSAFFQIHWRFCQLYISCSSSPYGPHHSSSGSSYPRSPDAHIARSPTFSSYYSGSGDRRESTESCMSAFSLPRSSISGMSSISSRSSSPSSQIQHAFHYYYGQRSRNSSSPSIKFTPSQPPSPLLPYGDSSRFHFFRRWSTYSQSSSTGSGHSSSGSGMMPSQSFVPAIENPLAFSSSQQPTSPLTGGPYPHNTQMYRQSSVLSHSRRWSVPASMGHSAETGRGGTAQVDDGLLSAINLLSSSSKDGYSYDLRSSSLEEGLQDYIIEEEQTRSLWPASDSVPGVVLTTCGSEMDLADNSVSVSVIPTIQATSSQLQVPPRRASGGIDSGMSSASQSSHLAGIPQGQVPQESTHLIPQYSLFGGTSVTTSNTGHPGAP